MVRSHTINNDRSSNAINFYHSICGLSTGKDVSEEAQARREEETNNLYEKITDVYNANSKLGPTHILGDMNAKIGRRNTKRAPYSRPLYLRRTKCTLHGTTIRRSTIKQKAID